MIDINDIVRERMEDLAALALKKGRVSNLADWCDKIGMNERRMSQIRTGGQYTVEQIYHAVTLAGSDFNYVFGLKDRVENLEEYREELRRRGRRWA